ncbi:MAG: thioesterase, partial [Pseudomonadales bacterium]|nr:thioesterase [Pseudomonadales bacterium]
MNNTRSSSLYKNPWFHVQKRVEQPSIRLFCFSYAGGSAGAFRGWCDLLPDYIEVCSVQLPGRGSRFREPPITNMSLLLDMLVPEIKQHFNDPFAFFGHSMGAQVSFELARRLRSLNEPLPVHLFESGRRAPQLESNRKIIHGLPEDQFLNEIKKLNGTPEEALQHPELMELVSPILRADIKLVETWDYRDELPLSIPITALAGAADEGVPVESIEEWGVQTSKGFTLRVFNGDHFFINSCKSEVLANVSATLSAIVQSYTLAASSSSSSKLSQ